MFFADLRGWTSFVDAVEPEELMRVLRRVPRRDRPAREALRRDGRLPRGRRRPALLQRSDRDPRRAAARGAARLRAARGDGRADAALARSAGYDLDFGVGIALGYATCGEVGFEGRSDYAAIGAVTNLASRLADEATGGQILIAQRLYAEVEDDVDVEPAGEFTLKGFQRPVAAFNVLAVRGDLAGELQRRAV